METVTEWYQDTFDIYRKCQLNLASPKFRFDILHKKCEVGKLLLQ